MVEEEDGRLDVRPRRGMGEQVLELADVVAVPRLAGTRQTAINWRRAKALSGKGLLRQIREQLELGFRLSIHPRDYYRNELHRPENAALAHHYLFRYMFRRRGIYLVLQQNLDERYAELLIDKGIFFETCSAGGLATAPTLLLVRDGEVVHRDDTALAQAGILFVKPTHGSGSESTFRLERRANGEFSLGDGGSVSASGLADWLKSLCNDQYASYMAQLCLTIPRSSSCRSRRSAPCGSTR